MEDEAFRCRHPLLRRTHIRVSRAEPVYKCAILVLGYFERFSSSFLVGESFPLSFLFFCFAVDSEAIIARKTASMGKRVDLQFCRIVPYSNCESAIGMIYYFQNVLFFS